MGLAAGDRLGRYEVVALLGRGGMGEVYLARDTRLVLDVAIKTAHRRFSDRVETEARAIAPLDHRNVCILYDAGPDYLVMEYLRGESLAESLKRGPLPPGEAVDLAIQVAEGLNAAHSRAVLHHDLKPANVMITPSGEVKLMDFGVAKVAEIAPGDAGETAPTTAPGQVIGTPAYLATEQIRGEPADQRTDVWAFGITLYGMLTGARPFRPTSTMSRARSILEDPVPTPSVRPGIPKPLDAIVRKTLAKEAANGTRTPATYSTTCGDSRRDRFRGGERGCGPRLQ